MSRFQFVADHRDTFEVKRLCQTVEISRSSFYAWRDGAAAREQRAAADAALAERITVVHTADRCYGAPRVTAELNDGTGVGDPGRVNRKRVARVMRARGIAGVRLRRKVRTTIPAPADTPVPDLLHRDFTAPAPNLRYVGDIGTYPRHVDTLQSRSRTGGSETIRRWQGRTTPRSSAGTPSSSTG